MTRIFDVSARIAGLALVVTLLLLGGAPAADAHNVLVRSDPAANATLTTAPSAVTLEFNEPVDHGFNEITVTGPDGVSQWAAGPATVAGSRVTTALRPLGPAGAYTVSFRIVSQDGHPVSGSYPFTLAAAGPGTPAPHDAAPAGVAAAVPDGRATVPVWAWIAGAVVLLLAGAVVARRIAR
ncbi:copper resistance protein [Amycolatopsis deserti]|uniref:Copper resistance protein n=1 Tax=Amycolatopsis deserti TaxID=185696 RepID=A0ABQ3IHG3_9PSEU|nr:copper resistance CopC family protein [Amycolatopsis deserti]GHE83870.1 copper resistance protein [Amycolatopsis deserti]